MCTAPLPESATCSSRRPPGWERPCPPSIPALKAMGEGHGEKLFYLTAKTITRSVAEEALFHSKAGAGISILIRLPSQPRKSSASWRSRTAIPEACPRAKGHYDRVNDAVYEIIQEVDGITRDKVLEYAGQI